MILVIIKDSHGYTSIIHIFFLLNFAIQMMHNFVFTVVKNAPS